MKVDNIQLKYQSIGCITEREIDFLFAEISRLQAKLENANRESNFRGELASKLADQLRTAEQENLKLSLVLCDTERNLENKIFELRTYEQRVARECYEICKTIAEGYAGHATWCAELIKTKYNLQNDQQPKRFLAEMMMIHDREFTRAESAEQLAEERLLEQVDIERHVAKECYLIAQASEFGYQAAERIRKKYGLERRLYERKTGKSTKEDSSMDVR